MQGKNIANDKYIAEVILDLRKELGVNSDFYRIACADDKRVVNFKRMQKQGKKPKTRANGKELEWAGR